MPEIPKRPPVPDFSEEELAHIESIVFIPMVPGPPAQAVLIFGGTHPGAWLRTIEAHRHFPFEQIFVTGGHKRSGTPHHSWTNGDRPEAEVIREHLLEAGIPDEIIHLESEYPTLMGLGRQCLSCRPWCSVERGLILCKWVSQPRPASPCRSFRDWYPGVELAVCWRHGPLIA